MFTPTVLNRRSMILIIGDLLIALVTVLTIFWILQGTVEGLAVSSLEYCILAVTCALLYVLSVYMWDGYSETLPASAAKTLTSTIGAASTLLVLLALSGVAFPLLMLGRRVFLSYPLMVAVGGTAWRLSILRIMPQLTKYDVAIAGYSNRTMRVADEIRKREHLGYNFRGFLNFNSQTLLIGNGGQAFVRTNRDFSALPFSDLKGVIVDPETVDEIPVRTLIAWRMNGIQVADCQDFLARLTGKLDLLLLGEKWLMVSPGFVRSRWKLAVKRGIDLVLAFSLGLLALPVVLLTAIAIKLESPGPLFYAQERIGLNNRIFRIIKFRSMREDAETRGPVFAAERDPRITRVGRFIRRARIDELPQLINVIKGEMSMIGPRPERPEFAATLCKAIPLYDYRHSMRPGLTGWAQICYPYGSGLNDSERDKLGFDLYYLKNWSLLLDAQILLETCKVVVFGSGAR